MVEDVLQTQNKAIVNNAKNKPKGDFKSYLGEKLGENPENIHTSKEISKKTSKPAKPAENSLENSHEVITKKLAQVPEDSQLLTEGIPLPTQELPKDISKELPKDISKELSKDIPRELPKDISRELVKEASKMQQSVPLASALRQQIAKPTQPNIEEHDSQTLQDVLDVANEHNLNPTKISAGLALSDTKSKPLSATQKLDYEFESKSERVAIINRGKKKPKNVTAKISNIYVASSKDEHNVSLSSLLSQKDLPQRHK